MNKKIFALFSILLIAAFALSACGTAATPTEAATVAPVATEAPTVAPTAVPVTEVTLWHAYGTGSAEETALTGILAKMATDMPNVKVNVLQIPFNDIFNKYATDVAAGAGPDIFVAPNDNLGDEARNGLIADITDLAKGKLGDYGKLSIDGMSVNGKLYGIPESQKAVVFWYNKSMMATPPATTADLQKAMAGGTPVSITYGCYHQFGWYGAFGGQVFDANWNVIADQGTGVTDAMTWLNGLYQISKKNNWPRSDSDGLAPFSEGKVAAITNGNWAMGDYKKALGDKLGVAPLPAGPKGPATPFLGIDGFYFNPNSQVKSAALDVALYLTNKDSQTTMMNQAGHVPANTKVEVTDPLIKGLLAAFANGYIRPQVPQLGLYWSNFCGTDDVFLKGVAPATWVKTGTANANKKK